MIITILKTLIFNSIILTSSPSDLDEDDVFEAAPTWLGGMEGIQIKSDGKGQVLMEGELHRASDVQRLAEFQKEYPQLINKTKLSESAIKDTLSRLHKKFPKFNFVQEDSSIVLIGQPSLSEWSEIKDFAPMVTRPANKGGTVTSKATVFLEIMLIEIKKNILEKVGLRVGSPLGAELTGGLNIINGAKTLAINAVNPLQVFLDLALQHGHARIHAKQSLVTRDGHRAEFHAGGKFPIRLVTKFQADVRFEKFGLDLIFTPKLEGSNKVNLAIDSVISEIDLGSQLDGIPVVWDKTLKTEVVATLGETMAIGGIVQSNQSQLADKIPGLSALPVLGRLFESKDFKNHQSEAYIFITPRRLDSPWQPKPEGF